MGLETLASRTLRVLSMFSSVIPKILLIAAPEEGLDDLKAGVSPEYHLR
jgi:hypothetical protein